MDIRFVSAILTVHLQALDGFNDESFRKEYKILSDFEEDVVGEWIKLAKARGETNDTDDILLRLMVELHKKVDDLTAIIKNEERELLELDMDAHIIGVGFDYMKLEEGLFDKDKEYYCRVKMPVFPKRDMPMFLRAVSENIAQIVLIHEKDQKDWNSYVASRERIEIREKRDSR